MNETLRAVLEGVDVVPKTYAAYRPLVIDGLLAFFERIPAARLEEIFTEQATFGDDVGADDRFVAVLRRCPTLHKLGQVLAHERGLHPELRARLQRLESLAPTSAFAPVAERIREELGRDARYVTLGAAALAEGSVAVIVPFEHDATREPLRTGVFKLLKPEAERRFLEELSIWPDVADVLEERTAFYGLPSLDYRGTLAGIGTLLAREVRLDREQIHLADAARFHARDPRIAIPGLLPFCTPRLVAMERLDGVKVTDPAVPHAARRRLAQTAIAALLGAPFWDGGGPGRFHADPHAGNLLALAGGRLGVVDWALVTGLGADARAAVVRALAGAATLDEPLAARAIAALGTVRDEAALARTLGAAMREVRRGRFPGFDWLTSVLDELARHGIVRFPEATTLFRKSLLSLAGVARDVDDALSIDDVLLGGGAEAFARDAPLRASMPFFGPRPFDSHLSNADVARLAAALPWLPARYWLETWRDLLGSR